MLQWSEPNSMIKSLTARAPAKLIISGEHSVLYGQPAIAMAVNRYTTTTTTWRDTPHVHFNLLNLAYAKTHSFRALRVLSKQLKNNYVDFLNGKRNIREVLKLPFELLQYSVSSLIEHFNLQLPRGVEVSVDSTIPLGCGMGSSASAVISTLYALANFLGLNWRPIDYLNFARELENLQHGKSSGLDLHLVTHGGCVRFQNGNTELRKAPIMPIHIINTGKPESTTGECVTKAASVFTRSKELISDFGAVTDQVDLALVENNLINFRDAIRTNNQLLSALGVVPIKVASFIAEIEAHGGAAKICGSGAVAGDNAGILMLVSERNLEHIVVKHGYQMQAIQLDSHGIQII